MSDKLFGLAGLGLDDLENMNIYGQDKKEEKAAAEAQKIEEKDLILLRFARRCFDEGPRAVQMLGDPDVHAAFVLERNVNNEVCRFIEFIHVVFEFECHQKRRKLRKRLSPLMCDHADHFTHLR